ncbi:uncharacterized protein LOC124261216 [Haliotis rubra]|uniref:uncharacterized protein LOC124261216 n=1 Tax=Haliotis rubra TaxID=36100 RepID=UPI001EE534D8|nr:uncharacterized protein LOC124261216 [Haliotis rubra]
MMGRLLHKLAMRAGTKVLSPILELPEGSRSPTPVNGASNTSQKRTEIPKLSEEECFLKHLQSIEAEYRQDMEKVRRELRLMQRTNTRIEKDLKFYQKEYGNYKRIWHINQPKLLDLKMNLVKTNR